MYTLKIKITKKLLEDSMGCQNKSDACVFARAFRDFFPKARVYHTAIYPFGKDLSTMAAVEFGKSFATTQEIHQYIKDFDDCFWDEYQYLPEVEFDLPIPDWVINRINIDEIKPLLENHHCLQLINS